MGNNSSTPNSKEYALMFDSFSYAPVTTYRTEATYTARFQGENFINYQDLIDKPAPLLRTAYWGLWSMKILNGIGPEPRVGQCHVYDQETDSLIIAYGYSSNGQYLNDAWALNLNPLGWRCITKNLLSPRSYASSVLLGRRMYFFGGAYENDFYADLHYLDLDTGEVKLLNTTGADKPVPRTSPAIFSSKNHIYLWSGFDGRAHGSVYRIRPSTGEWKRAQKYNTGVPAPAFCEHKGEFYVFGGVTGTPMAKFNPIEGKLRPIPCTGVEPTHELAHASLVSVNEFIFLIGGETNVKYMHIFALDVKRSWWFAFHVRPDNDSLTLQDGIINKTGNFMLPREHSASVIYSPREREIVSVMGSKMINPPPVFCLKIGHALAVLHLRSDMLDMFLVDHGQK
ncbi:Kelch motif family protein [Tritrichomonas foetus]|uniref:Kelch motif family protein n=1 Tax=Tritrichomonas foetus TaxID=1144522 RepID=A0A1J4JGM7_9EUKA|nr:Kelch motif family protein [Tritrichomonas foetus]|eukprot:OHS97455.1 Kelch motif family protein [Tritrichomonas foetus]